MKNQALFSSKDKSKQEVSLKKVNCRRLQSCGFFKYKNDSFQS